MLLAAACGDSQHAQQLCRQVAEVEPGDLNIWLQMLAIAVDEKDDKTADEVVGQIAKIEGEERGPIWSYCMAARLAAQSEESDNASQRAEALGHITRTLAARPSWPQALLLAAALENRKGQSEAALNHYLAAIELGGRGRGDARGDPPAVSQGQFAEADGLLKRMESQAAVISPDLQRLRTQVSGRLEDFDTALPAARAVAEKSDKYQDHLWLAQLCEFAAAQKLAAGEDAEACELTREAEQALQRATELAPESPDTWGVRLQFWHAAGSQDEAQKVLDEARTRFADAPVFWRTSWLAMDRSDDAAEQFKSDLAKWPKDVKLVRRAAEFCIRTGRPQLATDMLQDIALGAHRPLEQTMPGHDECWPWPYRMKVVMPTSMLLWPTGAGEPEGQPVLGAGSAHQGHVAGQTP